MKRPQQPVSVRSGDMEFLRTNDRRTGWRDLYRTILSLSWPRFALSVLTVYLAINVVFASIYLLGGNCIAEMRSGSFASAFFFSVQTLSTVGFGHLYPDSSPPKLATEKAARLIIRLGKPINPEGISVGPPVVSRHWMNAPGGPICLQAGTFPKNPHTQSPQSPSAPRPRCG